MLSIANQTRQPLPRLPFVDIAQKTIGSHYDLSLVFIGNQRARRLNLDYRRQNYVPNILSFPLSSNSGEIFINLLQAKREYKKFNFTYQSFIGYLFIHGLLHLKGYSHGSTMESKERALMRRFNMPATD
jgi:probable rRNA maturation factor